jgi:hypothetical protein
LTDERIGMRVFIRRHRALDTPFVMDVDVLVAITML